uniref:Cytosolic 5'-nucleotidase III-like protein n=1 Tax=Ictalurus furcatus TaxID=66913 RepID=E3TCQ8_ICTFU|nr:cytosolic 5'-nucleotidase III-like protein [Ictalurus furcatus]
MNILLKMIPELKHASVRMRDGGRVETIIEHMRREGPNALQVISDFDMTLTRFAHNGTRCPTSYSILHSSAVISEDCKAKMSDLFDLYYPVEINNSMSVEEKVPHMEEWWTRAHDLLIKERIRKDQLVQAVRDSGAMLREGYKSFFDVLRWNSVPLLIFSAGVGDILEEVITEHGVFHLNVRVFSNYMDFDQNIFTLQGLRNILRIGYLNDKVEERREAYVRSYDIVLEKDETLDVPNAILNYITAEKRDHALV